MANVPIITTRVTITSKDINGNSVAKTFNLVSAMNFDYNKGMLNIVDQTGSFYFPLSPVLTVTYTIVTGVGGATTIVIS